MGLVWAKVGFMFWKGAPLWGRGHGLAHWIWLAFCSPNEDVQEDLELEFIREFWEGDADVVLHIISVIYSAGCRLYLSLRMSLLRIEASSSEVILHRQGAYHNGYFEFPDGWRDHEGVSDIDPKDEILLRSESSQHIKGYREEHTIKVCNGFSQEDGFSWKWWVHESEVRVKRTMVVALLVLNPQELALR